MPTKREMQQRIDRLNSDLEESRKVMRTALFRLEEMEARVDAFRLALDENKTARLRRKRH